MREFANGLTQIKKIKKKEIKYYSSEHAEQVQICIQVSF